MERITVKNLETLAALINRLAGMPEEPYTKTDAGKYIPNAGCYHLEGAYGGYKLVQMSLNGGSGTSDALSTGYVSKRELHNAMHAFKDGILAASTRARKI